MQVKVQLFGKAADIDKTLERIGQAARIVTVSEATAQCLLSLPGSACGAANAGPAWVYRLAIVDPDAEPVLSEITSVRSDAQTHGKG